VSSDDRFTLFLVSTGRGYAYFAPKLLYELIDTLLIFMSNCNLQEVTVEEVLLKHDGIINQKFLISDLMVRYALHCIADEQAMGSFILNPQKVTKNLALALLHFKGDYYLNEFLTTLQHSLELSLPATQ
jgi:hypothetical protein